MNGAKLHATAKLRQWLPAGALAALIATAYAFGLHHHLTLAALAENRDALRSFVGGNLGLAVLAYMGVYVALVALSIPGAAVMSIAGGFLFGWAISLPATVTAATIGSVIVFQVVKTSLGAALASRAGPMVTRLSKGFAENAFSYLLFLRLAPVFPFFAVNAVAGLCRVPLRTFVVATVVGIIPAGFAFALLGSGLDGIIDAQKKVNEACMAGPDPAACTYSLDIGALVSPQLLLAFGGLGLVALLPIAFKYFKKQKS